MDSNVILVSYLYGKTLDCISQKVALRLAYRHKVGMQKNGGGVSVGVYTTVWLDEANVIALFMLPYTSVIT